MRRTENRYTDIRILYIALCFLSSVILFVLGSDISNTNAQEYFGSMRALDGQAVFHSKGCQNCHAIRGQGGSIGKDLGSNFKD